MDTRNSGVKANNLNEMGVFRVRDDEGEGAFGRPERRLLEHHAPNYLELQT